MIQNGVTQFLEEKWILGFQKKYKIGLKKQEVA